MDRLLTGETILKANIPISGRLPTCLCEQS